MTSKRIEMIESRIRNKLAVSQLEIIDDSHLHAGHSSAGGAGHFTVKIVSDDFNGLTLIKRHMKVYDAVADIMPSEIHALSIQAKTTQEA